MPAETLPPGRAEERRRSYRKTIRRACFLSVAAHIVAAFCLNPSMVLSLFDPDVPIGFPGRPRRGDLAPIDGPRNARVSLVRAPRYHGPADLVNVSVVGTEPPPDVVGGRTAKASVGQYDPRGTPTSGHPGQPLPGDPGSPVVIELGEDWLYSPGGSRVARSDKIQILKLVRPEYPIEAVRGGIEGLVKLEVHVDTLGKVVSVRTLKEPTADPLLEAASTRVMGHWEFKPYRVGSHAINFIVIVPFRYRLVE